MTVFEIENLRSGRHREWRVKLTNAGTVPDRMRTHPEFAPYLAVLYVSAPHDAAPFNKLSVKLFGKDRPMQSMDYDNTSPNPEYSIRNAPAWVKQLFADVTGEGHLINHHTPDARWSTEEIYSLTAPRDPAYPVVDPLPMELWQDRALLNGLTERSGTRTGDADQVLLALAEILAAQRAAPDADL
ncbi:hypothetical protein [Arthrobacter mobilis]|uniref:Uncharacterized protein n=1 Tax=Arthrobacter mobilis TaxID=2724944 RepID=A0A7X6HGI6_9MICC|nr:hypothetical protein [Arthrobacter mobilis]NKX55965.1 hypothetical protein [Arthrobacter mobilis]